jgi:DNA-binding NtrC family response regulator
MSPTTKEPDHLLVVEDETIARENLEMILAKEGYRVTAVGDGRQAISELDARDFDLVLTDLNLPGVGGLDILHHVRSHRPDTEVLVITGYATVDSAVEAMRKGAYFYVPKPYKLDALRVLVAKALEKRHLKREVRALRERVCEGDLPHIIGSGPAMTALKETLRQVAPVDSTVLLLGETGTGKELAARALHHLSSRGRERFLAVNCAAFSEELLANELFGHEREAFTGAGKMKKGLIETANRGTFFLDEIGDMPLGMQAKLLRVLENRTVIRVGGTEEVPVDVRFVAATNKDLKGEVEAGAFRRDLYFRLNVITLPLPALADRREDIPLLCNYFMQRYARRLERPVKEFSEDALRALAAYPFPGNVRELENIVERAVVLCAGQTIKPAHLPPDIADSEHRLMRSGFERLVSLKEHERDYIAWVLEQCGGNKTHAAEILEVDRATLWRKLKRLDLEG